MGKLAHAWVNWRRSANRHITRAPVGLLTGAGASIPLGVGGMWLPDPLPLTPTRSIALADLVPPTLRHEPLDLEGLMIIAQLLLQLPRTVVHDGISAGDAHERKRAHETLVATISLFLPQFGGGRMLSSGMLDGVAARLVEIDVEEKGQALDGLYERLRNLLLARCRELRGRDAAALWGPVLERIYSELMKHRPRGGIVVPVFTTNYDETFEHLARACSRLPFPCRVIFPTTPFARQQGWHRYDPMAYARHRPAKSSGLELVVFHLHGSIGWQCASDSDASVMAVADDPRCHGLIDAADYRARGMLFPDALKVSYQHDMRGLMELMAPESRDNHDFLPGGAFYPMRLNYLYFEKWLRHAKTLVAIGCSFRDADARDLLSAARARNRSLRLVLVDPTPDPVVARLGGAADWIRVVRRGFGEGATDEMGRQLSV